MWPGAAICGQSEVDFAVGRQPQRRSLEPHACRYPSRLHGEQLGNTCQELGYSEDQIQQLCEAYFGQLSDAMLARMKLNMIMSDVGWGLWAAIQAGKCFPQPCSALRAGTDRRVSSEGH